MTLCVPLLGGTLVPCSKTKKAARSPAASILRECRRLRDGDNASGDVQVPCMDGACARDPNQLLKP